MRRVLTSLLLAAFLAAATLAAPAPSPGESNDSRGPQKAQTGLAGAQDPVHQSKSAPKSHVHNKKAPAKPYQVGKASWYGERFDGRTTASGETYDMFQFTAAHRTLPLGTVLRVTNLHNGRSVLVRVNDRGPMVEGRIIDLSYGAAQMLQARDIERVRLDIMNPDKVTLARAFVPSEP